MKLLKIEAQNFKGFKKLDLNLGGKSTVIFGVNGAGKTSILSIVNYLFWNWLNRLNPAQGTAFKSLNAELVRIGSSRMEISCKVSLNDKEFILKKAYTKAKPGKRTVTESNKSLYDAYINEFIDKYENDDSNMPIFVNYGTNRSVLSIPLRVRNRHDFSKWVALERATENELDFKTFFEWFRNQEDYEAEIIREKSDLNYKDRSLQCVRRAVQKMVPEFKELKIKRNPMRMTVKKGNLEIRIDQLSDGEKCTLALLGDLARRLALANPNLEDPLEGEGIVLIDEIELHLHPLWQRNILNVLKSTFTNVQFIITTHSPQVMGEADDTYNLLKLNNDLNSNITAVPVERMDYMDSNTILETHMETSHINPNYQLLVNSIYDAISDKQFDDAKSKLENLRAIDANTPEVIRAEGELKRARYMYEKNCKG